MKANKRIKSDSASQLFFLQKQKAKKIVQLATQVYAVVNFLGDNIVSCRGL
jgi:hypothetical protein